MTIKVPTFTFNRAVVAGAALFAAGYAANGYLYPQPVRPVLQTATGAAVPIKPVPLLAAEKLVEGDACGEARKVPAKGYLLCVGGKAYGMRFDSSVTLEFNQNRVCNGLQGDCQPVDALPEPEQQKFNVWKAEYASAQPK